MLLLLVGLASFRLASGQLPDEPQPSPPKSTIPQIPPTPGQTTAIALQDQVDVLQYYLDLAFDPVPRSVSGSVFVTARCMTTGFRTLVLDLKDSMTVSSVRRENIALEFEHANDLLVITMDREYDSGETFQVIVTYSGTPISIGLGSIGWNKFVGGPQGEMVWTLSQPQSARSWWPSKDRPDDKAFVQTAWTVPETWTATGNGVLLSSRRMPYGRRQFRWRATHPLPPYLVMIAATDYVKLSDTYTPPSGPSMPVEHYVYPEHAGEAQESFSSTVAMISFFSTKFGEYPFLADKYGMSSVPWGGAMEHSTNTSYGYLLIDGGHANDMVIAHELAHQWWGDSVTPASWSDLWLSEGFATYSEALWAEHVGGSSSYRAFMQGLWREQFVGPLNPPVSLFNATVYSKGAWVLHMLRHVMTDPAFFTGLGEWYRIHRDATGTSAMLRETMEATHGGPLDWFFQQWVFGAGSPRYEYGWSVADRGPGLYRVYLEVRQTQTDAGPFTMPLDLSLETASGTVTRTVWNEGSDQDVFFDLTEPVTALVFDPDNWVLKASLAQIVLPDGDGDGVPDRADNCSQSFNPEQFDFDGDEQGNACDPDDDGDSVEDASDCAPLDAAQGMPHSIFSLNVEKTAPAITTVSWSPVPLAQSYDVMRGTLAGLRNGSYGTCLITGLLSWSMTDGTIPEAGSGDLYLVRAVNAGCGGPGPPGMSSQGVPIPPSCP